MAAVSMDTGLARHVDTPADHEGDVVEAAREYALRIFGPRIVEKWFNVAGQGYGTDWLYVVGVSQPI